MSEVGYVRIHRSLLGHPDFRNDAEAMAFAWMVIRAAWKPARVRYKGKSVSLGRGQLCVSQRDMADALDRDKAWVERLWKKLLACGMIEARREAAAMLITICKYAEYQADDKKREAVDKADARQARGTEQEREEGKKEETPLPPSGGRDRGSKIPDDWAAPAVSDLPPQARALAEQWTNAAYAAEAEAFENFWRGESGAKARKSDWRATWANRIVQIHSKVMRDEKFGNGPTAKPVPEMSKATEADRIVAQAFGQFQRGEISEGEFHRLRATAQRPPPAARLTPQRTGAAAFGDLISRINPTGAHH